MYCNYLLPALIKAPKTAYVGTHTPTQMHADAVECKYKSMSSVADGIDRSSKQSSMYDPCIVM